MNRFTIQSNHCLRKNIQGFYHTDYVGMKNPGNPDYLNKLKNTFGTEPKLILDNAVNQLKNVLIEDLPQILKLLQLKSPTVCVVPRAKADNSYRANQLLFKSTVQAVLNELSTFENGTNYICRCKNTKTTHLRKPIEGYVNDGDEPYAGITIASCNISENVKGKDILLIDDIYTETVNIDEDAIQALLDKGANSVTFYAIAKTVYNH